MYFNGLWKKKKILCKKNCLEVKLMDKYTASIYNFMKKYLKGLLYLLIYFSDTKIYLTLYFTL